MVWIVLHRFCQVLLSERLNIHQEMSQLCRWFATFSSYSSSSSARVFFFFVAVLVSTVVLAALLVPSGGFTTRQCNKTEWQQIEKYTQGTCIFKEAFVLLFASSNYQLWFFALTKFWLRFEAEKGNLEILNFSFVLKTD